MMVAIGSPVASAGSQSQCLTVQNSISGVSSTATATNDTTKWTETYVVAATFDWGNSSNPYPFSQTASSSSTSFSVYLNYLEPETTYYFEIVVPNAKVGAVCTLGTTYSGSFTTSNWPVNNPNYPPQWINGTITNSTGASPTGNTPMEVTCVNPDLVLYNPIWTWASDGSFSILVWSTTYAPLLCVEDEAPLVVEVLNYQNPGNYNNLHNWPGQWNESVVVWAPQNVSFELPKNYVGPYLPRLLDFSNFNYTNGFAGYSTVSYTQTTTYTDTMTYNWSLTAFPGSASIMTSGSSTYTATYITSSYDTSSNGSLDVAEQFHTSGTVEFDAIDREWASTSVNPYGTEVTRQNPPPQSNQTVDWMFPGTSHSGVYTLVNWAGVGLGPGKSTGGQLLYAEGTSSSVAVSSSYTMTVDLEGVPIQLLAFSGGLSQSVDMTSSQTLSWSVTVPQTAQGGVYVCFNVYGSGNPSNHADADMIGIWYYAPGAGDSCLT